MLLHKTTRSHVIHLDADRVITCADERERGVVISGTDLLGAISATNHKSVSASLSGRVGHVCSSFRPHRLKTRGCSAREDDSLSSCFNKANLPINTCMQSDAFEPDVFTFSDKRN